jgi:hypothetical protein
MDVGQVGIAPGFDAAMQLADPAAEVAVAFRDQCRDARVFLGFGVVGIPWAGFASRPELVPLLPEAFIEQRGALVFDLLGKECLVAVLNPFSAALRQEVERRLGAACHYYLVRASDFDAAAERLREMAEEE